MGSVYLATIGDASELFPITPTGRGSVQLATMGNAPRVFRIRPSSSLVPPALLRSTLSRLPAPETVLVADLTGAKNRQWQDRLDEAGEGSTNFLPDDADLVSFGRDKDDLITHYFEGAPAVTQVVERYNALVVSPEGEGGDKWTLSGPLHLALLKRALVMPSRGPGAQPPERDRPFDWTSPVYDDSWWLPTAQVGLVRDARMLGAFLSGIYASLGLLEPDAPELQPRFWAPGGDPFGGASLEWQFGGTLELGQPLPKLSGGTGYFRRLVGIPTTGQWKLWFTCSAVGDVFVDGQHVLSVAHPVQGHDFLNTSSTTVTLSAGNHLLAWTVSNNPDSTLFNPAWNPGFAAWILSPTDEHANPYQYDTLRPAQFLMSGAGDRMVVYVPEPPGMTPGQAMLIALNEAQARGIIPYVNATFDDVHDSAGNAWPTVPNITTKVGQDLLTFFLALSETYIDVWMAPGTTDLYAWIKGRRGAARLTSLDMTGTGGSVTQVQLTGETPVAEKILADSPVGWQIYGTGDVEATLALGSTQSESEVARLVAAQIAEFGSTREQRSVSHVPLTGHNPYVDYENGDTIAMAPDAALRRVTGITVNEDDNGYVTLITDDPVLATPEERLARIAKQMSNNGNSGTLGGRSKVAQPTIPVAPLGRAVPSGGLSNGTSFMLTSAHILGGTDSDGIFTGSPSSATQGTSWTWNTNPSFAIYVGQLGSTINRAVMTVKLLTTGVAYGNGPHQTASVKVQDVDATDRMVLVALAIVTRDFPNGGFPLAAHPDTGTMGWNESFIDFGPHADDGLYFSIATLMSLPSTGTPGVTAPITFQEFLGPLPGHIPQDVVAYLWNVFTIENSTGQFGEGDNGTGDERGSFDWAGYSGSPSDNFLHIIQVGTEHPLFEQPFWRRHITSTTG